MHNIVSSLLPGLESYRLPGLDGVAGQVHPQYNGYSLANLPASICRWLGAAPPDGSAPLAAEIESGPGGSFKHVILLVIDGLGLDQFGRFLQAGKEPGSPYALWNSLLPEAMFAPLTSIVPSTTATALTTLWTGATPGEHGIMGYEMWLKEYGIMANMITHAPAAFLGEAGSLRRAGFEPERFLPVPTLGPRLVAQGVKVAAFQHAAILKSGLSAMLFPEVAAIPFRSLSDLWVTLPAWQQAHHAETMFTYIYYSELDELSHRFGPQDERITLEFAAFTYLLNHFLAELRKQGDGKTLLLISADHGQIYTPRQGLLELNRHPELLACLHMAPGGEARLAYLYPRPGMEERMKGYIRDVFGERFTLVSGEAARQAGLFGAGRPHPQLADRTGDYVLIARGDNYLWWPAKENLMLGRHGGLSHAEMLVPLLGLVI